MKCSFMMAVLGFALFSAAARSEDLGGKPGEYAVNGDDAMVLLMPELKTAKAPAWLKPGMRLTWYCAAATIPGSYIGGLTQDPDGKWRDPNSGQTFRCDDAASASGHGFSQLEVIAVHDDVVVVQFTLYGIEGVNGPLRVGAIGAYSTPSGYLSGFWLQPDVLARQANLVGAGITVAKGPYECAGRRYDALWTSTKTASGSTTYVTDLPSGLVLHTGMATSTASTPVNLNGVPTNIGGQTSLSQSTFSGMRQLDIPWAGAPTPQVIANVRKLSYQGAITTMVPGSPPISFQCRSEVAITGRGKDFLQAKRSTVVDYGPGFPPNESASDLVSGCNQLTPLAIPPEHLARLRQGQVLDRDPVTKIATVVSFVGQDPRGNDVAIISVGQEFAGAYRVDCIYDRTSGILAGVVSIDPSLHTQSQVFLVGKQ